MFITLAYTVSSASAMAVNALFLTIVVQRDRRRRRDPLLRVRLSSVSTAFVLIWLAIVAEDLMMVGAGAGILAGYVGFGYLLAAMPLISLLVGIVALRWLR